MTTITEPGVYDIPADVYHADPVPGGSLSSSGARKLLATCPAVYRHQVLNPSDSDSTVFDLGTAVHELVLGVGPGIEEVDAADWRTAAAKARKAEIRAAGRTPLLRGQAEMVRDVANAVFNDPVAAELFSHGRPEQALFREDQGVWLRAMLDWLPDSRDGVMVLADLKTTESVHPDNLTRSMATYGYHQQAAWYMDMVTELGLADEVAFVFVFVQKTAPYLVQTVQPDPVAINWGRAENRRAVEMYRTCVESGVWPNYSGGKVLSLSLPSWKTREYEMQAGRTQ